MPRLYLSIAFLVLIIGLFSACDSDKPTASGGIDLADIPYSDEAQDMALYYSGEFYPPEQLTRKISNELYQIRTKWADSLVGMPGAVFETPWHGQYVTTMFDSLTALAIHAGTNEEWNDFLAQNSFIVSPFLRQFFNLRLPVKAHPERLAEQIEAAHLHGLNWMSVPQKGWPRAGNVARVENRLSTKYFFYAERCPDLYFSYAYFEIIRERIIYHGSFYECPDNTSGWWNGLTHEQIEAVFDSLEASRPFWVDTARAEIYELENNLQYRWSGSRQ